MPGKFGRRRKGESKCKPQSDEDDEGKELSDELPDINCEQEVKILRTEGEGTSKGPKSKKMKLKDIKIISWNVAGLKALIKKNGHELFISENPDIIALQEIKCSEIPAELQTGYHTFLNASERSGQSGVLLLTKEKPIKYSMIYFSVTSAFDDDCGVDGNGKGRIIVAEYKKYFIINAYVPNSGRGLVNLSKRKIWDDYYINYIKKLDSMKPVVYLGDLNVAHQEIDLANPKTNRNKTAGFTDQERNDFSRLLESGFVDVFRKLNPDKEGAYTFWSNMRNSREKNIGWRLDYFVVSERIIDNVKRCDILSSVKGSDHCPVVLEIEL
ncbi:unnamed protein product [Thelazia callipaeda]|uniref:exodeoxyribonuclease III n=1 Tax=Thelazia callipaeda TaxID=103827 RepID=A0A0N5CMH5_THECL|nr:unnamed protein product [Thelazia callipaeda]